MRERGIQALLARLPVRASRRLPTGRVPSPGTEAFESDASFVGLAAEPQHVGDDQQGRILQRQRVESELPERGVEVGLYSQAKWWRFQTSAQPPPPVSLRAPRSKQYASPVGSASAGVGSPSSQHRSMKCSCEAERSFNSEARHLAMNSCGVMGAFSVADDDRRPPRRADSHLRIRTHSPDPEQAAHDDEDHDTATARREGEAGQSQPTQCPHIATGEGTLRPPRTPCRPRAAIGATTAGRLRLTRLCRATP